MDECPICKETLNEMNFCKTKCGHSYCLTCIMEHLKNDNRCPLCRVQLCNITYTENEVEHVYIYEINGILRLNYNLKIILITTFIIVQFSILHIFIILSPLINYIKVPGILYS